MSETIFKDSKDRAWDLQLNLAIARRVDASDFTGHYKGEWTFLRPERDVMSAVLANSSFMFAIIFAIVQEQAKRRFVEGSFVFGRWAKPKPITEGDKAVYRDWTREERQAEVDLAFSPENTCDPTFNNFELAEIEFASSINAAALESGRTAFWRSLTDFFQDQKTVLDVLMRQYKQVLDKMSASIKGLEPEIETQMESALKVDMEKVKSYLRKVGKEGSIPEKELGVPSSK